MKQRVTKKAITTTLFLVVGVYCAYILILPAANATQHADRVHASIGPLASQLNSVTKSTEFSVVVNPMAPEEEILNDAEDISKLIEESLHRINLLSLANSSYSSTSYPVGVGPYADARTLHDNTGRFLEQSEYALRDYADLVTQLMAFHKATRRVTAELNAFNEVSDINSYRGKSAEVQHIASSIRSEAELLSSISQTSDTKQLYMAAIEAFNEAADGFDGLARGLSIPADEPIYAAAHKIESATMMLDTVTGSVYDETITQSRTIKNIHDLQEKLEPVLNV